jgi:LysR family transcriptional regulator, hydrogen peroxide-inducible genes activator
VPSQHPMALRTRVSTQDLKNETMLLLGTGHCFRDHVLEVCPEFARFSTHAEGIRKRFEGSSLETIKYMVAAGMGVTLVPQLSVPREALHSPAGVSARADLPQVTYLPISDTPGGQPPTRRVVLAWRRSFTRLEAIQALRQSIQACDLPGVQRVA